MAQDIWVRSSSVTFVLEYFRVFSLVYNISQLLLRFQFELIHIVVDKVLILNKYSIFLENHLLYFILS